MSMRLLHVVMLCVFCVSWPLSVSHAKDSQKKTIKKEVTTKLEPTLANTHYDQSNELKAEQGLPSSITKLLKKYKISERRYYH